MKKIKLLVLLIIVLGGLYAGAWYMSCENIAKNFIPYKLAINNNFLELSTNYDIESLGYSGFLQGQAKYSMKLKKVLIEYSFKNTSVSNSQKLSVEISPANGDVTYEIGGPVFGSTVTFSQGGSGLVFQDNKLNGNTFWKNYSKATLQDLTFGLSSSKFLFQREGFSKFDASKASLLSLVQSINSIGLGSTNVKMMSSPDSEPIAEIQAKNSNISWRIDADEMFSIDTVSDYEAKYGSEYLTAVSQGLQSSEQDEEKRAISLAVQKLMFGGNSKFIAKGGVSVKFPASVIGLSDKAFSVAQGLPAFSVLFNNLQIQSPFVFSANQNINGSIEYLTGEGKPLHIDLNDKTDGVSLDNTITETFNLIKNNPKFASEHVDFSITEPSQLTSFTQLEGSQGALIMVLTAARGLSKFYEFPGQFDLKLDLKTDSGKINPLEMFGAESNLDLFTTLGKDSSLKAQAAMKGFKEGKVSFSFTKPESFLKIFIPTFKVFIARSTLATFFKPTEEGEKNDEEVTPESEKEKKVIAFLFSEKFESVVINFISNSLKFIDNDLSSADIIETNLEIGPKGPLVNGKTSAQMAVEGQEFLKGQAKIFKEAVREDLVQIDPDLMVKIDALPID